MAPASMAFRQEFKDKSADMSTKGIFDKLRLARTQRNKSTPSMGAIFQSLKMKSNRMKFK